MAYVYRGKGCLQIVAMKAGSTDVPDSVTSNLLDCSGEKPSWV